MPLLSEYYSDPPAIADSLWSIFDEGSTKYADTVAMTVMHQSPNHLADLRSPASRPPAADARCLQWTAADLRHASLCLAKALVARGVERGSTLVSLVANGVECPIVLWTTAILQLTFAPLDVKLLDPGREAQLADYMRRLGPAVLVVPDAEGAKAVDGALSAAGVRTAFKVALSEPDVEGWEHFAILALFAGHDADPNDPALAQDPSLDRGGERVATILFTSGTSTGKPKGCLRSVRNLLTCGIANFGFPDIPDRVIVHTPNSGAIAQCFFVLYTSTGREIIIPGPTFSPSGALDAVEQHQAQLVIAIPVMSRMFEREMATRKRDLSALRQVAIGGDMVTIAAKEKFERIFPNAEVVVGHGMSEAVSILGWRDQGVPKDYPTMHNLCAIGHPQSGNLVRICDDDGKVLPRGEAGHLHLGGPNVTPHYLHDAQPESFYHDDRGNWMLTGDRALMNEEGVVWIIGRIKDIIKKVGLSLSPAVLESVLNAIAGVEAVVVGVPHLDYGEVPLAIVSDSESAAKADQLKRTVRDSLGADYALEDVISLESLGLAAWPMTPSGKVAKHELQSKLAAVRSVR